jgi:hypothetical protein
MSTDAPRGLDANIIMIRIRTSKPYVYICYIEFSKSAFFERKKNILIIIHSSLWKLVETPKDKEPDPLLPIL